MNRKDQIACDRPLGMTLEAGVLCARGNGHRIHAPLGCKKSPPRGAFLFGGIKDMERRVIYDSSSIFNATQFISMVGESKVNVSRNETWSWKN